MRALVGGVTWLAACAAVGAALSAGQACAQVAQDAPVTIASSPTTNGAIMLSPQTWSGGGVDLPILTSSQINQASGFGQSVTGDPTGPADLQIRDAWMLGADGSVTHLQMARGGLAPGGLRVPQWADPRRDEGDGAWDVSYTRGWPAALRLDTGGYALDVSPRAGVGSSSLGNTAEFGATVRFGGSGMLDRFVLSPGAFDNRGRWYLFAEGSGRAIGYDVAKMNGSTGRGLASERGFIGDTQAGVAWRKGSMQAAFGYVKRSVQVDSIDPLAMRRHEDMVGLTFSFRPHL